MSSYSRYRFINVEKKLESVCYYTIPKKRKKKTVSTEILSIRELSHRSMIQLESALPLEIYQLTVSSIIIHLERSSQFQHIKIAEYPTFP